jgi:branched-chain amino acid transport system permease protein
MDRKRTIIALITMAVFAAMPLAASLLDQPFLLDLFARIMILGIAAVSLDLILGYGGMVSFGHAVYIGIGAYAVGVLNYFEITNGFIHFPVAIVASAAVAAIIGAMSIRTSGVYFIMITLAFAQMLFFLGISIEEFGGDDGMGTDRSEFAGLIDLYDGIQFYYFCFACLAVTLFLCHRIVLSHFGKVIQGAMSNDRRMMAIGYSTYSYRLTAFVIAGAMCGVAGALFANWNEFLSPEYMHWTRSGEIMIMVILGGMGSLIGPVLGATGFLLLEEYLPEAMDAVSSGSGEHWMLLFGPILIALVLFARGGLLSLLAARRARHG